MQVTASSVKFRSYLTLAMRKEMTSGKQHLPSAKELGSTRFIVLSSQPHGIQFPSDNQRKSHVRSHGCQIKGFLEEKKMTVTMATKARLYIGICPLWEQKQNPVH